MDTTSEKDLKACVESLIRKAEKGESPDHALKFSQAACNAANAMAAMHNMERT